MNPARHDVITRTFRCRLRENWCFDLQKSAAVEIASRRLLQSMSQDEVFLQLWPAEVELPMLEPQLLGRKLLALSARDRNRRSFCRADDAEFPRTNFNRSCLHLSVLHFCWTGG